MTQGGITNGAPLQIAGQSLIEYQARALSACGVRHIVVMVETLPAALVSTFDRLRSEGFSIDTARTPQDAADRIHPDETVLVMAPGLVASAGVMRDVSERPSPIVATIGDDAASDRFERIDRDDRWAGVATVSGDDLRQTSARLGDWDFAATMLRVALQNGATRYRVDAPEFVTIANDQADAAAVSARLAVTASEPSHSPFGRLVAKPVAELGISQAMRSGLPFEVVSVVPLAILLAACLQAWIGWPVPAFVTFVLATVAHLIAAGMARCALRSSWAITHYPAVALFGFALIASLAAVTMSANGWGIYALAAWLIANAALNTGASTRWQAGIDDLALVLATGFVAGLPVQGFALAIGWQLAPLLVDHVKRQALVQR